MKMDGHGIPHVDAAEAVVRSSDTEDIFISL